MKLNAIITKCIRAYPDLYRDTSYEASRLRVLSALYLLAGNGFTWRNGVLVPCTRDSVFEAACARTRFSEDYFVSDDATSLRMVSGLALQLTLPAPGVTRIDAYTPLNRNSLWVPDAISKASLIVTMPDEVDPTYYKGAHELYCAVETQSADSLELSLWRQVGERHEWL